jgi:hypothetical protein
MKINKYLLIFFTLINFSTAYAYGIHHRLPYRYVVVKEFSGPGERVISVGLKLIDIPKYREQKQLLIYDEILSHSITEPFGDHHGRSTNAHETVHGINNVLRNHYTKTSKKKFNGFYAGSGKGILIEEPNITMKHIISYIPKTVRGYRFELYFEKQLADWNDTPTYPIDEWSAYIAGAECAVDDHINGKIETQKADSVSGALEFSIYCTALAMAVKDHDVDYWMKNAQFKHAIKYFLIKSEKIFFEGHETFPSKAQDELLMHLRNHSDTSDLRRFLMDEFEGIFVD